MAKSKPTFEIEYINAELVRNSKDTLDNYHRSELFLREAFMRAIKETVNSFGLTESFTIERLRGMMELVENFQLIEKDLEK